MSKKNRNALLWLLGVFGLLFLGLAWLFSLRSEAYALQEAEKQALNVLLTQRAVHTYISDVQRPEIYRLQQEKKLATDYFSPRLMSRTFIARQVMERLNAERRARGLAPIYFKLASDNPRNPINLADSYELRVLQRFNAGESGEFHEVVEQQGEKWLYLAVPVQANSAECLKCHGRPEAAPVDLIRQYGNQAGFYEQLGRKRALISIRVPLTGVLQEGRHQSRTLTLITLFSLTGVYLLIFAFMRRLDAKHQIILSQNEELARRSITDPLTGLLNRSGFLHLLDSRMQEAARYGTPLTLVMADIDHFKAINDAHGHAAGDVVLKQFTAILSCSVRSADVLCRWGGEEFLILLPQQDQTGGMATAENLRRAVEQAGIAPVDRMTASFGVAAYCPGETQQDWIARADKALYAAKDAGRNIVLAAPEGETR